MAEQIEGLDDVTAKMRELSNPRKLAGAVAIAERSRGKWWLIYTMAIA